MRRAWVIALAVLIGGTLSLNLLARAMGWSQDAVNLPTVACLVIALLVLAPARIDQLERRWEALDGPRH